jgi:MFS family permease
MTNKYNPDSGSIKEENAVTTSTDSLNPGKKPGIIALFRIPNFNYLFSSSILAYAIEWSSSVILSWLVYDLTGSGTLLGTVNLVSSAGSLCMLLGAGLIVDRFNRRKIVLTETAISLIMVLALGLLIISKHSNMGFVFVFTFIYGMTYTLDWTTRQVLVFDLVPRSQTPGAVSLTQTGWSLMRVLGPMLGGFLLAWFTAGGSFLFQAAIYTMVILALIPMKLPFREMRTTTTSVSSSINDLYEGVKFLFKERATRIFFLLGIIMPILIVPIFTILPPIFAVRIFGDSSGRVLGFLTAFVGIGGIIGGLFTAYLRRFEHWGALQLVAIFFLSVSLIAFAFVKTLPAALALMVVAGFFEIIFLSVNQTLIQLAIPDSLRGRVTAAVNLTWILGVIGSLISGVGADIFGPKAITIVMAAATAVLVVVIYLISPTVRNYRLSSSVKSNPENP